MKGHYTHDNHYTSDRFSRFERLRVDVGQTGFFEGREFRTFKELSIAAGATYVVRVVVPINVIVSEIDLALDTGWVRVGTYTGGTPGGVWSDTLPVIPVNNMSAGTDHRDDFPGVYTSTVTMSGGGTHTGGTELDVIRLKTNNNSNQSITVGAGAYYFRLLNLGGVDTATGVFRARWEERP